MREVVKLPLKFDSERLLQDLARIPPSLWVDHFNEADYEGRWSVIALYSPTGDSQFIHTMQTEHFDLRETEILAECRYLQEVAETIECPKRAVRLLRLHAGSTINEHTDPDLNRAGGVVRLHVPILTNSAVVSYFNGRRIEMLPGDCWYADFSLPHRVLNPSDEDRVHLVMDCEFNAWLREVFNSAGMDVSDTPARKTKDED